MNDHDVTQRRIRLEHQVAHLRAQVADRRHWLRRGKLGPIDHAAVAGEVTHPQAALRARLAELRHVHQARARLRAATGDDVAPHDDAPQPPRP